MIVLLVGLTISHVAGTYFLSNDRRDSLIETSERLCADHIAVITHLLDKTPPQERAALVGELGGAITAISLSDHPKVEGRHSDEDELSMVQAALKPYFATVDHSRLRVAHHQTSSDQGRGLWINLLTGFPHDRAMQVSFLLNDGRWVNFEMTMVRDASWWSPHAALSTLAMMVAILVFGSLATSWVGRPLATFAAAADRLGRDVNAPRLPEDGPWEVRRAVAAFNEMQDRIRRFVEDRTQMLAAISHDLRSPITRMRLRMDLLPEGDGRDKMLHDLTEMEAMVASSLEFARDEAVNEATQSIDLAATLAVICDDITDIGLIADFEWSTRLVCACRPTAMKRALTNLIENAARYGREAKVQARRIGSTVEVIVEDRGAGIPVAEREKVFNPFYRLDGSRNRQMGGIGLGMTVARDIIRAHGGDIHLEDRQGGGMRVVVILPQEKEV
ncbi:ATP-binding protein [Magnetospirillum molischianum]|uniref:histidine kinase n=1 Tax=Magnetospirillum molischianum DSM 120 TaxID=1150626 RepID=H8FNZ8_MAGML|nr:ATP-binding protein [Magnetospirillum molischianum]CCG40086.1 Putative two-component sensor histidine-kinase (modular protein), classical system [Magnetospirillum molischianum DSM 120]